jgi:tripartite-type tricarboxylate transporter receptor subunit TctC
MRKYLAIVLAVMVAAPTAVTAQGYPSRPITIVVPFPAGGSTDVTVRVLAERMRISLGQPLIIENLTGAGGIIGTARAARSAPDGYTLVASTLGPFVTLPATHPDVQYDPVNDFEPVALLGTSAYWLVGRKNLPAHNLRELIAWLKSNPNSVSAAMVGTGGLDQIVGIHFQQVTGTHFQLVPYRGQAPAIQDLIAGHVDLKFDGAAGSVTQVRDGQIKAFAVMAKTRWSRALNVPTIDEGGVPGVYATLWTGLWAPKGTPTDIIAKINSAVVEAFTSASVRQRLEDLGQDIPSIEQRTPQALAAHQKAEIEKWWPIIKAAGIKSE